MRAGNIHRSVTLTVRANDKVECRSFSHNAFGPYPASVAVDDALYRCQTNASSRKLVSIVESLKSAQKLARILHVETGTVIAHKIDCCLVFALSAEFNAGGRFFGSKLPSIAQEVIEHHP